jgi:hypothetical protein
MMKCPWVSWLHPKRAGQVWVVTNTRKNGRNWLNYRGSIPNLKIPNPKCFGTFWARTWCHMWAISRLSLCEGSRSECSYIKHRARMSFSLCVYKEHNWINCVFWLGCYHQDNLAIICKYCKIKKKSIFKNILILSILDKGYSTWTSKQYGQKT